MPCASHPDRGDGASRESLLAAAARLPARVGLGLPSRWPQCRPIRPAPASCRPPAQAMPARARPCRVPRTSTAASPAADDGRGVGRSSSNVNVNWSMCSFDGVDRGRRHRSGLDLSGLRVKNPRSVQPRFSGRPLAVSVIDKRMFSLSASVIRSRRVGEPRSVGRVGDEHLARAGRRDRQASNTRPIGSGVKNSVAAVQFEFQT